MSQGALGYIQAFAEIAKAVIPLFKSNEPQVVYQSDPAQQQMIEDYRKELDKVNKESKENQEKFNALQQTLVSLQEEHNKITDPTTFAQKNNEIMDKLVCAVGNFKFPKVDVDIGGNVGVGLFGNTSVGKSSILNAIAREKVCPVGAAETTSKIELKFSSSGIAFFDIPGSNDKLSYFEFETLAFMKALSLIVIVYTTDVHSCANLIRIVDALGVKYICVRNQIDNLDPDEDDIQQVRRKDYERIQNQATNKNLFTALYFISARNSFKGSGNQFDWFNFTSAILSARTNRTC